MITVSNDFRSAIANNNPQRPLIEFAGEYLGNVFTAEDISVDDGIRYSETLNSDTNLTMGGCPSATLSFVLLNRRNQLKYFEFGKCKASIGVRTKHIELRNQYRVRVMYADRQFIAWDGQYLYINNVKSSANPTVKPSAMLLQNGKLLLIDKDGNHMMYSFNGTTLSATGDTFNPDTFMKKKIKDWASDNVGFYRNGNTIVECYSSYIDTWEYCPLGVFIAERPKVVRSSTISVSCKDQMSDLDDELPKDITYPITVGNLLQHICDYKEIELKTKTFINSTYSISKKPADFKNATCRDVIGWIAEAACAYARFDRDGKLELVWYNDTNVTLTESDYSDYEQYWYETKSIDKLVIRDDDYSTDKVLGDADGTNGYIIENNPILKGGR